MPTLDLPFPREHAWLLTRDVAHMLNLTTNGVRFLVRSGELPCERTLSGCRLFREAEVLRLVAKRARRRHPILRARMRLQMAKATLPVATAELQQGEVTRTGTFDK